jgi:succinylarginine dihydrolase
MATWCGASGGNAAGNQFRRYRRPEPQLRRAQPGQPGRHHAGGTSYPARGGPAGPGQDARQHGAGAGAGLFLPLPRPNTGWLPRSRWRTSTTDRALVAGAWSASSMWTANAATVSPAPDTADGRCHLTVANLVTMPHRSHEWPDTSAQLRLAFADVRRTSPCTIPVPPCFGDEGAANHMRLAPSHASRGWRCSSMAAAAAPSPPASTNRRAGSSPASTGLIRRACCLWSRTPKPSPQARSTTMWWPWRTSTCCSPTPRPLPIRRAPTRRSAARCPGAQVVEVPASAVSLDEAVRSYLFNAQLLTLPDPAK